MVTVNDNFLQEKTFYGLSTDTKPTGTTAINGRTAHNGDVFVAMDIKCMYIYNEASSEWVLFAGTEPEEEEE